MIYASAVLHIHSSGCTYCVLVPHSLHTPTARCPEMLKEQPYGVKNDIWALGCVMYELSALKPAFQVHRSLTHPRVSTCCLAWGPFNHCVHTHDSSVTLITPQAFNMDGLVKKITSGPTPAVPAHYSADWKSVVRSMLCKEEGQRPSAHDILRLPWLQARKGTGFKGRDDGHGQEGVEMGAGEV